jgi:hypothetical protein
MPVVVNSSGLQLCGSAQCFAQARNARAFSGHEKTLSREGVSDFPRGETIELWRKSSEVGRWRQPKSSIAPRG